LELVWDSAEDRAEPLLTRLFVQVIRFLKRYHINHCPDQDEAEWWQISRMRTLEDGLLDYLEKAPSRLIHCLSERPVKNRPALLLALADVRPEAADVLLPLLAEGSYPHASLALDVLRWSMDRRVGPCLRDRAIRLAPRKQRMQRAPQGMATHAPDA